MSDFTVWTIPGSPYARAVIAVLIEKGADWRLEPLGAGEQRAPDHLARHPFGKMPAFAHGDFAFYETQAILRYIDRVLPEPRLSPGDPRALAKMDQLLNIADNYLFRGVGNVIGFQRIVGPMLLGMTTDEAAIAAAMPDAHRVMAELSRLLGDADYFGGGAPDLADFMLAPQVEFLTSGPEWQALTEDRRNLDPWLARMAARPSMARTTMPALQELARAA